MAWLGLECALHAILFHVQKAPWNVSVFYKHKVISPLHQANKILVVRIPHQEPHCTIVQSLLCLLCKHLELCD